VRSCSGVCTFLNTSWYLVWGYPALQDQLEVKPPLQYSVNSMSLALVRCMLCIIIVVSFLDKWGICSRCRALVKPRVHCHNQLSMTRMRVVASSFVSPDHRVQWYCLMSSSHLQRYSDSRLVVLFLWAVPLETTPLLLRDLDSQLLAFPFSFQLLVLLMMTTKVVFLHSSTCAFPVSTRTWPGIIQCCRVGRPEPNPICVGSPVSVCHSKTM